MRKLSNLRKSIYRVYVWVLIVTLVSMFTSVLFSYSHLKKVNKQANTRLFESINNNIEQTISDVASIYSFIINSTDTDAILKVDNYKDYFNIPNAHNFSKYLNVERTSDVTAYIYIEKTDTVIAHDGVYRSDYYYKTIAQHYNISYDEWINGITNDSYFLLDGKNRTDSVQYNMTYENGNTLHLGAIINSEHILDTKTDKEWYSDCNVYITDEHGKTILELNATKNDSKKDMYTSKIVLFITKANLVIEYPSTEFLSPIKDYLKIIFILSLIFIVLNLMLLLFSAKKNYKPIEDIVSKLGMDKDSQFEDIGEKINSLLKERELNLNISKEIAAIKKEKEIEDVILCIIKSRTKEYISSKITNDNIINVNSQFCLFSIEFNKIHELFPDSEISDKERFIELALILDNISREIFEEKEYICRVFSIDEKIVGIVSGKSKDTICVDDVKFLLDVLVVKMQKHFSFPITYVLTKKYNDIMTLSNSYMELNYLIQYKKIFKIEDSLFSEDIERNFSTKIKDIFDHETERKFINNISNGNIENSIFILDTIFDRIKKSNLTKIQMKLIISDVTSSFYKITSDYFETENNSFDVLLNGIHFEQDIDESYNQLYSLIHEICKNQFDKNASATKRRKAEECLQYLKHNYADSNLNLNTMSFVLGMDSGYLSRLFKEATGSSFSEYLTSLRIEHAKKALRNTNASINVISTESGFANLRTFNRVFKKQEGLTPMEFRKSAF